MTQVVKVTGSGVTSVTTAGVATTTGSTFIIWSTMETATGISSVADSKSNAYGTSKFTQDASTNGSRQICYIKENGTGGAGHTATVTYSGATYPTCFFIEVTGAAATSYDTTSKAQGTDSTSTFDITSGTFAQASNVVLTFITSDAGGTNTYAATGYTVTSETDSNSFWTGAVGYKTISATTAQTASWTDSAGGPTGLSIFGIKLTSSGNSYVITPSGGVTFSGNAPQIRGRVTVPSGSVVFSGAATFVHGRAFTPGGSVQFSGSAVLRRGRAFTPGGFITFSGSAPISNASSYTLSAGGFVTMSGTSLLAHGRIFLPTGAVTFSGTVPLIKSNVIVPTGQIVFSGTAPITFSGSTPSNTLHQLTVTFVGT